MLQVRNLTVKSFKFQIQIFAKIKIVENNKDILEENIKMSAVHIYRFEIHTFREIK